jgi:two-component system sensor histidine kinase CpxA
MVLLAASDSLSGSGMFFDAGPWMIVGVGAVLLSILFWFPLARGFTRSISQITHATEEIAAGRFGGRVNSSRPDELGRLAEAINQMASRLSGFVTGQKRFLGDIAHELCSPIARIQLLLGIIEQRDAQPPADPARQESYQAHFDDLREEIQQMSSLVNELLSFSKASLRPGSIKLQAVALRPLVEQAARREAGGADAIQCEVQEGICVLADPDLLLRSLANLLRNAFRYAGTAGPITVSAQSADGAVLIRVCDCGPGVPAESLPLLFDPFYRPESSRDRETGGAGLGLAIVKTCIECCQGTVTCRNREPKGFEVEMRMKQG